MNIAATMPSELLLSAYAYNMLAILRQLQFSGKMHVHVHVCMSKEFAQGKYLNECTSFAYVRLRLMLFNDI